METKGFCHHAWWYLYSIELYGDVGGRLRISVQVNLELKIGQGHHLLGFGGHINSTRVFDKKSGSTSCIQYCTSKARRHRYRRRNHLTLTERVWPDFWILSRYQSTLASSYTRAIKVDWFETWSTRLNVVGSPEGRGLPWIGPRKASERVISYIYERLKGWWTTRGSVRQQIAVK